METNADRTEPPEPAPLEKMAIAADGMYSVSEALYKMATRVETLLGDCPLSRDLKSQAEQANICHWLARQGFEEYQKEARAP
jgi:hypothetical protein